MQNAEPGSMLGNADARSATVYTGRWLWVAWLTVSLLIFFAWVILAGITWNSIKARQNESLQENAIALARTTELQLSGMQASLSLLAIQLSESKIAIQPSLLHLTHLAPISTIGIFTPTQVWVEGAEPAFLRHVWDMVSLSQYHMWNPAQVAAIQHCIHGHGFCVGPLLRNPAEAQASSSWGFPVFQPLSGRDNRNSFVIAWVPLADGLFPAWSGLNVVHQGASFLLRSDGMLLSRYPYSPRVDYATAQTGTVVKHWLLGAVPVTQAFSGYSSAAHAWRLCAARPIAEYHLVAGQCIGRSGLAANWWKQMHWPTWGAALLLLLSAFIYRYLARLNRSRELERATAEKEIWEAKEHAEVTLYSIGDGVISTDCSALVTNMNPVAEALTGWTLAEAYGKPLTQVFNIVGEADGRPVANPAERALREGRIVGLANHTVLIDRYGQRRSIEDSAAPIRDQRNVVSGSVLVFHDVTEKHDLLTRLSYQATHDLLTGLPNRVLFQEHLGQAMRRAKRHDTLLIVGFLDLDDFKMVNDRLGHAAGDNLLVHVARCFREELRDEDMLCRFGGDEFAFFVNDIRNVTEVEQLARRILKMISLPVEVRGEQLTTRASLGMTVYPIDYAESCDDLVRHADLALYASKGRGGNTLSIFASDMEERQSKQLESLRLMEQALIKGYLQLYFQPIVHPTNGLVGAEALLRMQDPHRGLLGPSAFSQALDHPQLAQRVGRLVLHRALEQMQQWASRGFYPKISINISAQYLLDPKFLEDLETALEEYGDVLRQNLVLEITETAPMLDFERARETLIRCQALGCKLALDDFGTGNASLSYLQKLPVSSLKIDQSFIRDILSDPKDYAIVSGIAYVGEMLNLQVVAEGVETVEQIKALHQLRCSIYQGYYFSRPMPAEELENWKCPSNFLD
ncbi:putative bifunctional diguanylate cyclase/phosphodiesterase [Acidithiobacillus sp. IBUN Pt1247-S3]